MSNLFFAGLLFFAIPGARAWAIDDVTSETILGTTYQAEALTASGQFQDSHENSSSGWVPLWNLGYTQARFVDTVPAGQVVDINHELTAGLTGEYHENFLVDGTFTYSATPLESLAGFGPTLGVGYFFHFGENSSEEKSTARPYLLLRMSGSLMKYTQTLSGTNRATGATRAARGTNSIDQASIELSAKAKIRRWLKVKVSVKKYSYNRNVADFLNQLDSQLALRSATAGLSSSVSGLPATDTKIEFTFRIGESLDLITSALWSASAVDGSLGRTLRATLEQDFGENWRLGLGVQNQYTPAPADNGNAVSDNQIVFKANYYFE
ncbi:MAG: hypothetical protein C5B49_03325 [Bdellovibrio sp.]|nr:MAG: hypothetical protein C5B49_03325 [Bdellovibrio sp.]